MHKDILTFENYFSDTIESSSPESHRERASAQQSKEKVKEGPQGALCDHDVYQDI